jgi:hypothetical protein
MLRFCTALGVLVGCAVIAQAQDDTLDWVMGHATTAPSATQPTTRPSPLTKPQPAPSLIGTVTLSDGSSVAGPISTTPGKPLRIWVEEEHQYVDVPLADVRRIESSVLWERIEREWHFIASGSDVKEYTGRTYPARELQFTFTLRDGRRITGGTVAPLYVQTKQKEREPRLIVLPKRPKGEIGSDLASLLYPKAIEISGQSTP